METGTTQGTNKGKKTLPKFRQNEKKQKGKGSGWEAFFCWMPSVWVPSILLDAEKQKEETDKKTKTKPCALMVLIS